MLPRRLCVYRDNPGKQQCGSFRPGSKSQYH